MGVLTEVASLSVSITADTAGLESGLSRANSQISNLGSSVASAFGTAAVASIAAVGAGFVGAVTAAAGFESQMSAISAVSGATGAEMAQLSTLALDLGKNTSFSASEAAQGIGELVKAGVSIGDVMGGAASASLSLAAAGAISVGDAAEIASNAMNAFNLKGSDLGHVADVIAGAANASAIDVNDFKFSLAAVGAVAATAGLSFDDTAVAIAELGQAGIKGSDAGTSLKTFIGALTPNSKAATTAMKQLGLITEEGGNQFFDAAGKMKGMEEIQSILNTATKGLTEQQKLMALETIFGSDAIRAAAVLAKDGAEGFDEMAASMSKVTAEAVASERLNNLAGSWEQFKGSVETLAITFGMALLPALRSAVDGVTGFVNSLMPLAQQWGPMIVAAIASVVASLMAMDWSPFLDVLASVGATIAGIVVPAFALLQAAITPVLSFLADHLEILAGVAAAFASLVVIGAAAAAIGAVGAAIALLISPLGLVVAAIGLLTAAWIGNWGGIQEKTASAVAAITPLVEGMLTAIEGFWAAHGETILAAASAIWDGIVAAVSNTITLISGVLTAAGQVWNGEWAAAWQTLTTTAQTIWDGWSPILSAALAALAALFAPVWAAITAELSAAWTTITTTVQTALDGIGLAISTAWTTITTTVTTAMTAVLTAMQTGWQGVVDFITGILASIQAAILAVWNQIPLDIRTDLILITTFLVAAGAEWLASLVTSTTEMLTTITTWIATTVTAFTTWATDTGAAFTTWATTSATTITTMTADTLSTITTWISTTVAAIVAWGADALAPMTELIGTATAAMTAVGAGMLSSISSKLDEIVGAISEFGGRVVSGLRGIIGEASSAAAAIGAAIVAGVRSAVLAGAASLAEAAANMVRRALEAAKHAAKIDSPSKLFADEVGSPIVQGMIVGMNSQNRVLARSMESMMPYAVEHTRVSMDTTGSMQVGPSLSPSMPARSSGGGGVSTHVFVIRDPDGRTLESWYLTGRDVAIRRGVESR